MFLFVCPLLGPTLVAALKKDWASPYSIALSWHEPDDGALPILDYEIKYYEKVDRALLIDSFCVFF
jgi:hypothetical protein